MKSQLMMEKNRSAAIPRDGFFDRQPSIVRRQFLAVALILLLLPLNSCTRSRIRDELQLNFYFAEILKREGRRDLGEDGFFEKNLLGNPHVEVRQWCALALGRIASPRALPWLYKALHAEYASVRAVSAFAIGEIEDRELPAAQRLLPDPRASTELIGMLGDSSVAVRMRAIEALGKIGDSAASVEIVKRLERCSAGGSPAGRACLGYSITAMARLKDPGAIPALEKLAESEDPEIRRRAMEALDRLRSGSAGPFLNADSTGIAQESGLFIPAVTDAVAVSLAADRRNSTIAILETTEGIIEIELFREDAPLTAAGFVLQAKAGGFDELSFAPASPFLVATGRHERPANNRWVRSEVNMRPFVRGSVGVALSGRDSRADGFFIALAPQPYLDGVYTCFGRVVSGIQVAERLASNSRIKKIRIKETISFQDYRRY